MVDTVDMVGSEGNDRERYALEKFERAAEELISILSAVLERCKHDTYQSIAKSQFQPPNPLDIETAITIASAHLYMNLDQLRINRTINPELFMRTINFETLKEH